MIHDEIYHTEFLNTEDKEILKSGYRETEKYLQGNTSSNSGRCLVCDIMEARRKRPKSSQALKEELSIVNSILNVTILQE